MARDGENALVVPPENAEALSSALARRPTDRELRSGLSEGGRVTARALTWERTAQRYELVYVHAQRRSQSCGRQPVGLRRRPGATIAASQARAASVRDTQLAKALERTANDCNPQYETACERSLLGSKTGRSLTCTSTDWSVSLPSTSSAFTN